MHGLAKDAILACSLSGLHVWRKTKNILSLNKKLRERKQQEEIYSNKDSNFHKELMDCASKFSEKSEELNKISKLA